ncbi:MAG: hypothetical protein ACYCPQ_00355 [Elusimicrobiota bacterium]
MRFVTRCVTNLGPAAGKTLRRFRTVNYAAACGTIIADVDQL